jgi:hypothetical protein
MIDKGHCFMNIEDEEEYERFYDFSKTYENHPDAIKVAGETDKKEDGEEGKDVVKVSNHDEWEDIDVEDAKEEEIAEDMDENEGSDDEEKKSVSSISEGSGVAKSESSDPVFSIISDDNKGPTSSFEKVDMTESGKKNLDSEQFSTNSFSSINKAKIAKKGKSREEAALGLNIKKAELLDSGEIKLGNGKIIGHRSFAYIYK